jgi:hypothetical protein
MNPLSAVNLRRAADIKERIESLEVELAQTLENQSARTNRVISPAARGRIAAGMRAGWASRKKTIFPIYQ